MARSTIANRRAILLDGSLILRDFTTALAIAATTAETAITSVNPAELRYYKAVVDVAAHTGYVASTAQWVITIEASADNVTFVPVGTVTPTGVAGRFQVPLSGEWVEKNLPNASYPNIIYTRAKATKLGTPGNLNYGAFLTS
ncbi:hypothetical protein NIES4072_31260 [Nostoc commune NIES-4072]|uniref:Uncharacterized protein n=1 Tax=Nostoc commune NIES-4072 TaxID=2005467 RepID=A0A2R5FPQ1_NOSCO|nr:hypothetical protein [Nostoc commune]BBD69541.1 hypothetical protein NIES4070_59500 [Nostoc commune HK-02]GBG19458.1 hypothetical protein NIES4072_31260 [Nostoc commune NIES-4072]